MGIQIYIKKEALERAGVQISYAEEEDNYPCRCGEVAIGYCNECESDGRNYTYKFAHVQGLEIIMYEFSDTVCHDANHWGTSRKPIIEFINKHKLKAGEDWCEA